MKLERKNTHFMTLLSSLLITLMLVILSPTYVQADRILEGYDARKWLINNNYIEKQPVYKIFHEKIGNQSYRKRVLTYKTTRKFERFSKLFYSDPPSSDGFKGWNGYNVAPRDTYPMYLYNIVITVDWERYQRYINSFQPTSFQPIPKPSGATECRSIGPKGKGFMVGTKQSGNWCMYHRNGRLSQETPYAHGVKHGMSREYYDNGNRRRQIPYWNGKYHGKTIWWYRNGNSQSMVHHDNGVEHGEYRTWYENGRSSACFMYTYGKRVKCSL